MIAYPFVPKSTAYLNAGDFWDIPLGNGTFACGRIIQLDTSGRKRHTRMFLGGLMDWCAPELPTMSALDGAKVLFQTVLHVRSIGWCNGMVRGWRDLALEHIEPAMMVSGARGLGCLLYRGLEELGPASDLEQQTLPEYGVSGMAVLKILATERYGGLR